jgi:hypothetical protein
MRAKHGNFDVEIWKIDPKNINEDWVKQAFDSQIIWWNMPDRKVLIVNNSGTALTGILPKMKISGLGVSMGVIGWYLVKTADNNYRVIDENQLKKQYSLI